jgi:hypothetical protein
MRFVRRRASAASSQSRMSTKQKSRHLTQEAPARELSVWCLAVRRRAGIAQPHSRHRLFGVLPMGKGAFVCSWCAAPGRDPKGHCQDRTVRSTAMRIGQGGSCGCSSRGIGRHRSQVAADGRAARHLQALVDKPFGVRRVDPGPLQVHDKSGARVDPQ